MPLGSVPAAVSYTHLENEIREIKRLTAQPFRLIAVKVERWNDDLSPWCAPAVFGHEDFGDGAAALLREILPLCEDCLLYTSRCV